MIYDLDFKLLSHNHKGYRIFLNGQYIEPGYKPDFVFKNKNDYIILESETTSSRKTYVGGLIKAAHFLQGNKTGNLIFVIFPKKNTKVDSIAKHLKPYLKWINEKTNLKDVFVISADEYYKNKKLLLLHSKKFAKSAIKV